MNSATANLEAHLNNAISDLSLHAQHLEAPSDDTGILYARLAGREVQLAEGYVKLLEASGVNMASHYRHNLEKMKKQVGKHLRKYKN